MTNFRIIFRSLMHYRLYSAINILGLALSLTCVVIISRYVYNELTTDGFNRKLDRMYVTVRESRGNNAQSSFSGIGNSDSEQSVKDLSADPAIEKHSQFFRYQESDVSSGEHKYNADILVADSLFLQIMDFPIMSGAKNLKLPEDAFITEAFAKKIFGSENPVGKTLDYPAINKQMTVRGIIGKPINKSIITFDLIISSQIIPSWSRLPMSLILLHPNVDYRAVNNKYGEFVNYGAEGNSVRYQLFPYKKVYFENSIIDEFHYAHGKFAYVIILSGVGFLLLLIGTLNYINIYTIVVLRR
ncbi:MAG: ABC transporter permease, partial [Prevotellaceae bacterium]|nr:ABC transporter permease [Prevotellaceae bacterium]